MRIQAVMKKQISPHKTKTMAMDGQGIKPSGPRPTASQLAATRLTYVVRKSGDSVAQKTVVTKSSTGKN